jgi:hypothetical protein
MVGALGELFGALAVVASLLYVGNQVSQNNRIARAEAYRDVTLSWARMLHQWADDTQSSRVFMDRTGLRLADLSEDVRNTYLLRHAAMVRVFEAIYRQVGAGVLTAEALDLLPRTSSPLFRDSWMSLRGSYSSDFRDFFEQRYGIADADFATSEANRGAIGDAAR